MSLLSVSTLGNHKLIVNGINLLLLGCFANICYWFFPECMPLLEYFYSLLLKNYHVTVEGAVKEHFTFQDISFCVYLDTGTLSLC